MKPDDLRTLTAALLLLATLILLAVSPALVAATWSWAF